MTTISTFSGILFLILAFIIGMIANYLFSKSGKTDYKGQWEKANAEKESLGKDLNRSRKSHDRLENERDGWKQKYEDLQNDLTNSKSDNRAENKKLKTEIDDVRKELETAIAEKNRSATKMERMKSELESIKRKIAKEREGYKDTKSEVERQKLTIKSQLTDIEKLQRKNSGLKEAAEKNFQKMADINEITSLNRRLKAKNVKLTTDVEYWEKKHYETHHELAALKLEAETLRQKAQGANTLN